MIFDNLGGVFSIFVHKMLSVFKVKSIIVFLIHKYIFFRIIRHRKNGEYHVKVNNDNNDNYCTRFDYTFSSTLKQTWDM